VNIVFYPQISKNFKSWRLSVRLHCCGRLFLTVSAGFSNLEGYLDLLSSLSLKYFFIIKVFSERRLVDNKFKNEDKK